MAQQEIDLYEGLARATGGQVSSNKGENLWFLIEFKWDKAGRWSIVDNKAKLYVNTRKGRKEIRRLSSKDGTCILATKTWANRVRSDHIRKDEAWEFYESTIKNTMECPLAATTLTMEEYRKIESLALTWRYNAPVLPPTFHGM
eukprot:6057795-Ditylum_brightwellii.AAC.1